MPEQYLCSAQATSSVDSQERQFSIYVVDDDAFKIVPTKGASHISHASRKLNDRDIKAELALVYNVTKIRLEYAPKILKTKKTRPNSSRRSVRRSSGRGGRR